MTWTMTSSMSLYGMVEMVAGLLVAVAIRKHESIQVRNTAVLMKLWLVIIWPRIRIDPTTAR